MSWSDPARRFEPAEDRALREELAELLGAPASRNFFGVEPTPELTALADKLRAEADRRRHTSRKRPAWMLMAAALPFLLAVAGVASWGVQQKRRADEAHLRALQAAQEAQAQAESARRSTQEASRSEMQRDREDPRSPVRLARQGSKPGGKVRNPDAELVLPVDHPLQTPGLETRQVKAQGQPQK
ncbi:MAG: hypothetical protein HY823_13145 [Acidobacteria bacterium]|nr:hypothetical protein [Acidobacteriota bacterium]